ncbi:hypothetical protein P2H44_20810 [Albimonas sp. CAU 1670]|uniref:hypothetical protein n=1 Tax=Albimonas sp. CAU 1670 TaxID=3032599 RepID=UPI0023DBD2CD|nr:hypothetical protein [Albimonas sp. CAU 1670]MDF2235009.1 hypothetical protein [Albimonas sp. CAU 1670]
MDDWRWALYAGLGLAIGVAGYRRSRRAAEAPARLTAGEQEALGPMRVQVLGLFCAAFFGLGGLLALAMGKDPWIAAGSILFAFGGVWIWGEVGRLELVWDARGLLRRSALRGERRFSWDELEAVRVGNLLWGGDRLFFRGGRGVSVPNSLTNHTALFSHARAVLEAREAA